jgi:spore germination protein GerM
MLKTSKRVQISLIICLTLLLALSGCGRPAVTLKGTPVEPILPGEDKGEMQALQGRFAVKSADVLMSLSATSDGTMVAVGSASRTVYLLESDGRLRWERLFNTVPLQTYLEPSGRFMAVGTAGGRVYLFNPDQSVRLEQNLGDPVGLLKMSANGELMLAGLYPEKGASDKVVILDRYGRRLTEMEVENLLDGTIAGPDNRVILNWEAQGETYLGAFTPEGEKIWEVKDRNLLAVSGNGRWLASSSGQQIFYYANDGEKVWSYNAAGVVRKLVFSENGLFLTALVRDEASLKEELLYLNTDGDRLWSKRLPDESELEVSSDGRRVVIASWRQYRDDATQILIYNQRGTEINTLEVAGRVQKMALRQDTLVLGLEDGSIYFLNIASPSTGNTAALNQNTDHGLQSFYHPVDFRREKDETLLTLFFYDLNAQALIPVTRRTKWTQTALRSSIEELVRGPVQGSQLQRTIPKDVEIAVALNEGVAVVDLPAALDEMSGTTFLTGALESLLLTISQFPTVEGIRFIVGGKEKETFGQDGLIISNSFAPRRFNRLEGEQLIFLPYQSGSRYYLLPLSYSFLPLKEKALAEALVLQILSKSQDLFPNDIRLKSLWFDGNTAFLNFSGEIAQLTQGEDAEAAAIAAVIRDAIVLSITENLNYTSVKFLT